MLSCAMTSELKACQLRCLHLKVHGKIKLVNFRPNIVRKLIIVEAIFGLLIFSTAFTCPLLALNVDAYLTQLFGLLSQQYQIAASKLLNKRF
jgi:hypothetical protein